MAWSLRTGPRPARPSGPRAATDPDHPEPSRRHFATAPGRPRPDTPVSRPVRTRLGLVDLIYFIHEHELRSSPYRRRPARWWSTPLYLTKLCVQPKPR